MTILVRELRERARRATPGPWELQTSNSWRRIGTAGGRFADGDVLAPTTHRGDNHPDLAGRQEDLDFIVAADPTTVLALLDEIDRLQHSLHTASANRDHLARELRHALDEQDRLKAENAELKDGMNRIICETGLGDVAFGIACEVMGELGVQQEPEEQQP
ncbi:ead/Ea22-like family protein [Pseudomonas oryzihabitans]|uniref:ead/Ea22-like family protein n=1 Tax=Pseudomonas oryzihabitans TaxID=47885 RepID=UPI002894940B|nr:ead/Ea22-like family protein [Pseudomonas oryzihabitans]MDT3718483.1 ead/Ea22-like family protein [Pseudomonas oryzihabitans]